MKSRFWEKLAMRAMLATGIIFQFFDLVSILATKPRNQKAEGVVITVKKLGNTKSRFTIRFYTRPVVD